MSLVLLGFCKASEQYYKLTLADEKGCEIVDFELHPRTAFKPAFRNVKGLYTAQLYQSCPICGSRRVGGCSCLRENLQCEWHVGFRFPCIYCDQMKILGQVR